MMTITTGFGKLSLPEGAGVAPAAKGRLRSINKDSF
jgi:hypothetical protein